jgi:soluble lytic murein transglycosylase-like protein
VNLKPAITMGVPGITVRFVSFARRTTKLSAIAPVALLLLFGSVPAAHADYAVLRSGQRLNITGWQRIGDDVRLDLAGGSVTMPAGELVSVEPEEIFAGAKQAPEGPFASEIRAASAAYGVDEQLIASVIAVESKFNPRAVSKKGAYGLMQLLPETATRLSVRNIFDPAENINAGTHYLKELLDRFGQNLTLALAAYNAGPERVTQFRGVPPYPETQHYVRNVAAALQAKKTATP